MRRNWLEVRSAAQRGPLTSRGTRPPIVHDRIQDHHHPRTTTTKCGGSIEQHGRVPQRIDSMETCPTFAGTSVSAPRRGSATPGGEALVTFSFLPPALLEKTGTIAGYKEVEMGARRGCAGDGGDATFIRYFDATTCLRVDGSDAVGARSLSNLRAASQRAGERGCWGEEPVQVGSSQRTPAPRKPAHTSSLDSPWP